jgi:1-deoxyxylulose-5-phosphate synthase
MRYRTLGRTGLDVSELCLGTMTFGWTADEPTSHAIMDAALDGGINFFDTADIYSRWSPESYAGKTEEIIGAWLRGRDRSRVIIATKVRGPMRDDADQGLSRSRIMRCVEDSLRRLQTEYIDLYQTHWPDDDVPLEETLRALDDLIRDGKVRAIGCSNETPDHLRRALAVSEQHGLARYESLQPHYNLIHRDEFERELRGLCQEQQLGVIPYSPLAGGFLSGKYRRDQPAPAGSRGAESGQIQRYMQHARNYDLLDALAEIGAERGKSVAQTALAWLLDAPSVTTPIVGAKTVAHLTEALGAVGYRLSAAERQRLEDVERSA